MRWPKRMFWGMVTLEVVAMLAGCTHLQQYRTHYVPCEASQTNKCALEVIEETRDYLLGFVEFDDQGWLWSPKQVQAVRDRLYEEEKKTGLIMVVYAHGWKHNASYADPDVKMFREVLSQIQAIERTINGTSARRVAGVYLGWRGLSLKLWGLKNLTFWERKRTAHVVGQGAVSEVLAELEELRTSSRVVRKDEVQAGKRQPTMLVVAGHSFGGAVLFSSFSGQLQERLVENSDGHSETHAARGFGDLTVLVNPAFEAARLQPLKQIAEERSALSGQGATLAVFTSKGDLATKYAFPLGRFFTILFQKHRDSSQYRANLTAVGHYKGYTTYDLKLKGLKASRPAPAQANLTIEESVQGVQQLKAKLRQSKQQRTAPQGDEPHSFGQSVLVPRSEGKRSGSVYVVSVDKNIIPNHSDIGTPQFLSFIREFIMAFGEPQ